jgi:hypothetical protein
MAQPLIINQRELNKYSHFTQLLNTDMSAEVKMAYELALMALTSKQCNEPYEKLLADCLGIQKYDAKHGWDAADNKASPTELYEFKPAECNYSCLEETADSTSTKTSKKKKIPTPSGTINDDSVAKIEKCEQLEKEGKRSWLILAGIDKKEFIFRSIYKFPMEVFNEDRRAYLQSIIEKNKTKTKQTRVTYNVNVKKAIELCHRFGKTYYVWTKLI